MNTNSQKAVVLKDLGNSLFSKGQYADALAKYKEAIALDPLQVVFHSNASQCLINLKRHQEALEAANKALSLDPNHVKSLVRRSSALRALSRNQDALTDLQHASMMESNNKNIVSELTTLMEVIKLETDVQHQTTATSVQSSAESKTPKYSYSALKEASTSLQNILPDVPQPATTFGEFEVHWRSLLAHPDLLHSYLCSISPSKLSSIFKDLMTADMLYSWLLTVSRLLDLSDASSHSHGVQILENVCSLPRFSLLRIFLSPTQVELIKHIFSAMSAMPSLAEDCSRLKGKFM